MQPNGAVPSHAGPSDRAQPTAHPASSSSTLPAGSNAVGGPSKVRRTSTSVSVPNADAISGRARPDVKAEEEGDGGASVRPMFDYPPPTAEQLDDELPPLRRDGDVGLGLLLDRVVGKGYKDLRVLVGETLVSIIPS